MSKINIIDSINMDWIPEVTGDTHYGDKKYRMWFYVRKGTKEYSMFTIRPGFQVPADDCMITVTSDDVAKVVGNIPNYNFMVEIISRQLESVESLLEVNNTDEALRILRMIQKTVDDNKLKNIINKDFGKKLLMNKYRCDN